MVRTVAERISVPAGHVLEEFGDMMILTGKTIWSALRPPYPYGGEFVSQFLFALRLCWFPLLISTVEDLIAKCNRHGVVPGIQTRGLAMAKSWAERGMRFVGCAAEHVLLLEKAKETVAALRTVRVAQPA